MNDKCGNEYQHSFVQMLGVACLHQTALQTLRSSLLSAQSEDTGGFVAAADGSPGMILSVFYQCPVMTCAVSDVMCPV